MAKYKMNTYMYGAKSDPYHSRFWEEPYPTQITHQEEKIGYLSQDMLKSITDVAKECKVDFIWAIHPGKAFAEPAQTEIVDKIMNKFENMYSLGVREFGVFVDDVGVPSEKNIMNLCAQNLTKLQQAVDSRWNTKGADEQDMVKPLHYVPQLYAYGWTSLQKGEEFYKSLANVPQKVNIYITGKNVWSVPNNTDIQMVKGWLGKNVSWWWNYVCNDQDMTKIFVADMYTNFKDETHILSDLRVDRELEGLDRLILNPMQQGELSKIGLFSVADYSWNNAAFNNELSWQNAIEKVLDTKWSHDFRIIAPTLRYYDDDALGYLISRYKQSVERKRPAPDALIEELEKINKSTKLLMNMEHSEAIALLKGESFEEIDYKNSKDFQFEILGGMGEDISFATRCAEPANETLLPFIYWLREMKI